MKTPIHISDLLANIAEHGFTKGCANVGVKGAELKRMCEILIARGFIGLTPFSTKQQILYHYIARCCVEDMPLFDDEENGETLTILTSVED